MTNSTTTTTTTTEHEHTWGERITARTGEVYRTCTDRTCGALHVPGRDED